MIMQRAFQISCHNCIQLQYTISDEKSAGLKFGEFGKLYYFCQTLFTSITPLILHNLYSG